MLTDLAPASRPGRTLPKTRVWASDLPPFESGQGAGVATTTRRAVPDYLRNRYYDPATGQFISRDPAAAATRQPYTYGYDNPLNMKDPSGLFSLGGCVSGQASLVFSFSADICAQLVVNTDTGQVSAGSTETYTNVTDVPEALGTPSASANAFGQFTSANDLSELGGRFVYAGVSGGPLMLGILETPAGSCAKPVQGFQLGATAGAPEVLPEVHAGFSNTLYQRWF